MLRCLWQTNQYTQGVSNIYVSPSDWCITLSFLHLAMKKKWRNGCRNSPSWRNQGFLAVGPSSPRTKSSPIYYTRFRRVYQAPICKHPIRASVSIVHVHVPRISWSKSMHTFSVNICDILSPGAPTRVDIRTRWLFWLVVISLLLSPPPRILIHKSKQCWGWCSFYEMARDFAYYVTSVIYIYRSQRHCHCRFVYSTGLMSQVNDMCSLKKLSDFIRACVELQTKLNKQFRNFVQPPSCSAMKVCFRWSL
jgi:hypothetical protein